MIELGGRRVDLAGCTPNPSGARVAQQARSFAWTLSERASPVRFLIYDRDAKFTGSFDEVFQTDGIKVVTTA